MHQFRLPSWREYYSPLWGLTLARLRAMEDAADRLSGTTPPSRYHDDCVIALALANSGRVDVRYVGEMAVLPKPPHLPCARHTARRLD